jgi:hypothetical protein
VDIFLKKMTPPEDELQAGPSGRIPEVGIVNTEDDGSLQAIAPKDPPVGQDVEVEDTDFDDPDPVYA